MTTVLTRGWRSLRRYGVGHALARAAAVARQRAWPERVACFRTLAGHVGGRRGLEVGGPTPVFARRALVPVYPLVGALDNVNFSTRTVWEGELADAGPFRFDGPNRAGTQFIREATDLRGVPDGGYDFLLSSHVLEHLADPLGGLAEWVRVVRPGGTLLLLVPHREGTFDHRRPVTPLSHLEDDLARGTAEDDQTHVPEILAAHDFARDPGADPATFASRCRDNARNRCLHHHVFDTLAAARLVDRAGLRILCVEPRLPFHVVAVAEKPAGGGRPDNAAWLAPAAGYLRRSPFRSDRQAAGGGGGGGA